MKIRKLNKITKLISGLLLLTFIALPIRFSFKANASISFDEADRLFFRTLEEVFEYENIDRADVDVKREPLFDIGLDPLGAVYEFKYENTEGYAILIDDGELKVIEISTGAVSPYNDITETKIYVMPGLYWYHTGEEFFDCDTGAEIDEAAIDVVSDKAFFGSSLLNYDSEQVEYIYRSEAKYNVLTSIPCYEYGLSNGCAPIAGTNLIAYYDKSFVNLIPNYEPGTTFLGKYNFKTANSTTNSLAETLHVDMGTNSTGAGTTVNQFRNGLSTYVNRNGYSISYSSLMSGGHINYDSAKAVVQSNKAIAIFLAGYRSTIIATGSGYDVLSYEYATANHTVAGFGCLEVNYTLPNNQMRQDRYIHCAMGVGLYKNGYLNINTAQIDEALTLNIS